MPSSACGLELTVILAPRIRVKIVESVPAPSTWNCVEPCGIVIQRAGVPNLRLTAIAGSHDSRTILNERCQRDDTNVSLEALNFRVSMSVLYLAVTHSGNMVLPWIRMHW